MNAQAIQGFCVAGADAYLAYLRETNKGLERIRVVRKEVLPQQTRPAFKLVLAYRLFTPDGVSLELRPPGETYGPDSFRIIEYDGDARVLIVEVLNPALALEAIPADALYVVSDLRFLVENVGRWFASNGSQLRPPEGPATCPALLDLTGLEGCQQEAVRTSLGQSLKLLTYIWGPPGTGKTRHVLTRAAVQLLLAGKRVGIFAPTNNALEQAMASVIDAATGAGISKDACLRVGHPSAQFAKGFPEVCEIQGLQGRLAELQRQIGIYEKVLSHRRGATILGSAATLRHELGELQELLRERSTYYDELAGIRANPLSRLLHFLDGKSRTLIEGLASLERRINGQREMIRRTRTESRKLNAILERLDFTNVELVASDVSGLEHATRQYLEVNRALAEAHERRSSEEIGGLIAQLQEQYDTLRAQTVLERIRRTTVVGMTLDCFIGRFHDTVLPLDHVFLDEAGYAPLVKALTLCRGGTPLTFVGDHKQLGPVCEMDDENLGTIESSPAVVWRKSALFLDELFLAENADDVGRRLFDRSDPRLRSFACAQLNVTFRFGQNLASILSTCVYDGLELVSADRQRRLEIICINAVPQGAPEQRRENRAEVEAILSFVSDQTDLRDESEDAYAILTPYRNQVALIGKALAEARREGRIMTVHKSQGREWNTVILSVVDGRFNKPWFTDTMKAESGGLYVMNTAISRARRRLVLVCDRDFWSEQDPAQLIARIVEASGRGTTVDPNP